MKILIIEDHKPTADYICKGLREYQFHAEAVYDGLEALYILEESPYDVVVLDVILPSVDGWTILGKIRKKKPDLPILMLSACDDVDSRVRGLEAGANDYLIKPFSFNELLARIKSLLHRQRAPVSQILIYQDVKIDLQKYKVYRGEKELHLSPKEMMLLAFFIKRQGDVLSRTIIAEHVWDINFDSNTNAIDVAIKRLREKIDQDYEQKLIHTIRGVGYVLEAR